MDINDIKHLAVERIYLFPGEHDGEVTLLWGDDPAPGLDMDPSEAVEYVRKDVHDAIIKRQASSARMGMDAAKQHGSHMEAEAKRLYAECSPQALESEREANAQLTERIAELEALVEQHRVAEEMQIKLREKADEREAALAAHIQDLAQKMDKWADDLDCLDSSAPDWGECMQIAGQIRVAWHYCDSVDKDALASRDQENMRKGFWWGFERARMRPNESSILAEWEDVKALIAKNEQHRKSNEG